MVSVAEDEGTQAVSAASVKAKERVGAGLPAVASKSCGKLVPLIIIFWLPRMLRSASGVAEVAVHEMVVRASEDALLMAPSLVFKTGT